MFISTGLAVMTLAIASTSSPTGPSSGSRLTLAIGSAIQDSAAVSSQADSVDQAAVPGLGQETSFIPGTRLTASISYAYLFNSSIEGGGSFSLGRFRIRGRGITALTDTLDLSYGARYQLDSFDFSDQGSNSFFGNSPWSSVDSLQLNMGGVLTIDRQWRVFGGGQVRFGAESEADWADGIEAGGAVGVSYSFSPSLTIGGGFGVTTRLEDSLYFYPIVIADWRIYDNLLFTTRMSTGWGDETGIELVYTLAEGWDVGLGAAYEWTRFRLDDEGPASRGVGVIRSLPVYGFLRWNATTRSSISIYSGLNAWGQLEALDANGNTVADQKFRPGFLLGIQGQITF